MATNGGVGFTVLLTLAERRTPFPCEGDRIDVLRSVVPAALWSGTSSLEPQLEATVRQLATGAS